MYRDTARPLTFETLVGDPLTRLVMDADGVSLAEFVAVLEAAAEAVAARARPFVMRVVALPVAMNAPA